MYLLPCTYFIHNVPISFKIYDHKRATNNYHSTLDGIYIAEKHSLQIILIITLDKSNYSYCWKVR